MKHFARQAGLNASNKSMSWEANQKNTGRFFQNLDWEERDKTTKCSIWTLAGPQIRGKTALKYIWPGVVALFSVILALWEAEEGGWLEAKILRPSWATEQDSFFTKKKKLFLNQLSIMAQACSSGSSKDWGRRTAWTQEFEAGSKAPRLPQCTAVWVTQWDPVLPTPQKKIF